MPCLARCAFQALVVLTLLACGVSPSLSQPKSEFEQRAERVGALQLAAEYLAAEREVDALVAWTSASLGKDATEYAHALSRKAGISSALAKYQEAGQLYTEALAVYEKRFPPGHPQVATGLNNLGAHLLAIGDRQGSERLLRQALAIREAQSPPVPLDVSGTMTNLALAIQGLGRIAEAEALLRQALELRRSALGGDESPLVAAALANLALAYHAQGKYAPARELLEKAVAIRKRTQPPGHPEIAGALTNLGLNSYLLGKPREAEDLFAQSLAIRRKSQPPHHPEIANNLLNLAIAQRAQKRLKEAHLNLRQAVTTQNEGLTRSHPALIAARYEYSLIATEAGQAKEGLSAIAEAYTETVQRGDQNRALFSRYLVLNEVAANAGLRPQPLAFATAFDVAQRVAENDVAKVVARMAARHAATDPRLAELARQRDSILAHRDAAERRLSAALGLAESDARTYAASIRKELADLEAQLAALDRTLATSFPTYFELINFKPAEAEKLKDTVRDDEILVQYTITGEDVFTFAYARDRQQWFRASMSRTDLVRDVQALRRTLDAEREVPFDVEASHRLYKALLFPLREALKTKRKIVVVPTGPLSSIPFETLLTEPAAAVKGKTDYAKLPWLVKSHAVLVVPSVGSLQALRSIPARDSADAVPFLGIGNPVHKAAASAPQARETSTRGRKRSGFSQYWAGGSADIDKIFTELDELPETEKELRAVGATVGAGREVLKLRAEANVAAIKALPLERFRIVYFATHGLVAGEVAGLAEPALVLSRPAQLRPDDMGLLTASEVSELKLNADWVVLSACNTAAGDQPGADGLRGLARAFFQAGARALLVSHWRIDSETTVDLMTRMFQGLKAKGDMSKAEALRAAVLDFLKSAKPELSHPTYWAAFSVVGDG